MRNARSTSVDIVKWNRLINVFVKGEWVVEIEITAVEIIHKVSLYYKSGFDNGIIWLIGE